MPYNVESRVRQQPDEYSAFHQVKGDEVWNLYTGQGIYLYQWDGSSSPPEKIELSSASCSYCHVIPGNFWQAAVPIQDTILVGCTVSPGFEFTDFKLMDSDPVAAKQLQSIAPELAWLIHPLKKA